MTEEPDGCWPFGGGGGGPGGGCWPFGKRKRKPFIYVCVLIAVLLIGGGTYLLVVKKDDEKKSPATTTTTTAVEETSTTEPTDAGLSTEDTAYLGEVIGQEQAELLAPLFTPIDTPRIGPLDLPSLGTYSAAAIAVEITEEDAAAFQPDGLVIPPGQYGLVVMQLQGLPDVTDVSYQGGLGAWDNQSPASEVNPDPLAYFGAGQYNLAFFGDDPGWTKWMGYDPVNGFVPNNQYAYGYWSPGNQFVVGLVPIQPGPEQVDVLLQMFGRSTPLGAEASEADPTGATGVKAVYLSKVPYLARLFSSPGSIKNELIVISQVQIIEP